MHEILYFIIYIIIFGFVIHHVSKIHLKYTIAMSFFVMMVIFLNVNPCTNSENKMTLLSYINKNYLPKGGYIKDINLSDVMYPFIVKPCICTKGGNGVKLINNRYEYDNYMNKNIVSNDIIMWQEFIPYEHEVGILYEKQFDGKGKIVSIVKKTSNDTTIMTSCYGNVNCINMTNNISKKLENIICDIAASIPNFNVGRFDVKYKDELSLFKGKNFYILEANGTMGFDLRKNTADVITNQYYINRWVIYRLLIGLHNIANLKGYNPQNNLFTVIECITNCLKCNDWERLFVKY